MDLESDPKVRSFISSSAPVLGVLLLIGAAVLVYNGSQLVMHPHHRAPLDNPFGGVVLWIASCGIVVIARRLLDSGERRSDGGILPPWLIAMGGVLFLFAPVMLFHFTGELHLAMVSAALGVGVAASAFRVIRARRS